MYKTIFTPFHHKTSKRIRNFFIGAGVTLWLGATIAAFAPILPHLLYRLSPRTPQALAQTIGETVPETTPLQQGPKVVLPPFDSKLSKENRLIIEKIGVNGIIHEGEDWEEILRNGIWRTPDWGTPENDTKPIILASHRWGYLEWTNTFRKQNSFYSLPRLEEGDQVKIIWEQREYIYEIYKKESGEQITDLKADLILYTCQLWNSPTRVFLYTNRIN